jgi:hypothetical protein
MLLCRSSYIDQLLDGLPLLLHARPGGRLIDLGDLDELEASNGAALVFPRPGHPRPKLRRRLGQAAGSGVQEECRLRRKCGGLLL